MPSAPTRSTAPAYAGAVDWSARRSVAPTRESSLQLALVHLGAPLDVQALRLPIELLLGPLTPHCHEIPPFRVARCSATRQVSWETWSVLKTPAKHAATSATRMQGTREPS